MSQQARNRWIYLLPLVVIVGLVVIFGKRLVDVENGARPDIIPTVLLNTPVPPFDLPGLPGRADVRGLKSDDLKGEVTLVNFWGSWCPTCVEEHPMLMALARENSVPIHGVDWRDAPEKGLDWLKKRGDPYIRLGQDVDSQVAIAFGVVKAPETFVVDAAGIIRYKHDGAITPEVWATKIAPVIEKLRK